MKNLGKRRLLLTGVLAAALVSGGALSLPLRAQTPPVTPAAGPSADSPKGDVKAGAFPDQRFATEQRRIADSYEHLEQVLLRMAELTASTDPRRAALLRRVVAESKDRMVGSQLGRMVELLSTGRLSRALEGQKDLDRDLRVLLELLLSENRAKQAASEKARIREYLRQLGQLLRSQKSVQGRTAGGGDPRRLAGEQGSLAEKTGDLAQDVQRHDEAALGASSGQGGGKSGPKGDSESEEDKGGERNDPSKKTEEKDKPADSAPRDKTEPGKTPAEQGKDGQPQGDPKDTEGQQGPPGQPSQEGQPAQGSPGGQSSPAPPQSSPVQKNLEAARQRMRDAQKKLDAAQRHGAVEDQEEAIRQLEQAKAELEEILRQLREEEIERTLTFLEARFKQMLEMQRAVYQDTQRLDKVAADQRGHEHEVQSGRLSQKESLIVVEADRALLLLREDGSSTAFPEAVSQMRDDMRQVVLRLARSKVDKITQSIEEAIIAALEEMVTALGQAIEQQEARRAQQQAPPGEPQEPPLVDQLAELRMIRALQMRVNQRTERYSKLIDGEQAGEPDLLDALRRLAEHEARIHQITRNLESGKNP